MLMHDKIALRRGIVRILVGCLMTTFLQLDRCSGRGVDPAGVRCIVMLAAVRNRVLKELGMGNAFGR